MTVLYKTYGGNILGLFDKLKEPVFLRESNETEVHLEKLKGLEPKLNAEGKAKIRQDIKNLEYGIYGEKRIAYELRNIHMPVYILHNIYLESGDLNAQIDFLVFTRKICFVIECKNLYGDIEINNAGDFIRTMDFGGRMKKEGIYSPITQNQRHLELMRKIKIEEKRNFVTKFITDKLFDSAYKPIVVLANPKTVLNAKAAKKEVMEKVIRIDQLILYIKEQYKLSKEAESSDEKMLKWANSFLNLHKHVENNYLDKYQKYLISQHESGEEVLYSASGEAEDMNNYEAIHIEDTALFNELKAYRLARSREENIKPYYMFNDLQLKELIGKLPKTKQELRYVSGFGPIKAEKYGDDILKILSKYW